MTALHKAYHRGTHRLLAPEVTLANVQAHLPAIGVTRCADVTGLDRIGIPVYCAVRPRGKTIQVTNGKGLRHVDARVSALMEALEIFHAEDCAPELVRSSLRSMRADGRTTIPPKLLPRYRPDRYFSSEFMIDWIRADELVTGREVWLPASAVVFFSFPMVCESDSNGLASGNEITEATLHALYEVIERDAISRICVSGRIRLDGEHCKCVDLATVKDGPVRELIERLARADIKLVLLRVASCIPVDTFWAVLLDQKPFGNCSTVNIGYGTHVSAEVGAVRAITEAAQTRLTYIHGAREDLHHEAYLSGESQSRLFALFDRLEGRLDWKTLPDRCWDDLLQDYRYIIAGLTGAGYENVFRVDLTRPPLGLPVVKVIVPRLQYNERLF
jgi:ribosomal protein S12 methylthiotransferase accessory factor